MEFNPIGQQPEDLDDSNLKTNVNASFPFIVKKIVNLLFENLDCNQLQVLIYLIDFHYVVLENDNQKVGLVWANQLHLNNLIVDLFLIILFELAIFQGKENQKAPDLPNHNVVLIRNGHLDLLLAVPLHRTPLRSPILQLIPPNLNVTVFKTTNVNNFVLVLSLISLA